MWSRFDRPTWGTPRRGRVRVLVEHTDECTGRAATRVLEEAGYDAHWCGGPDHLRGHRCPLVEGQGCELAAEADIVVHGLNPDRPEQKSVLQALRAQHPCIPIVAEIPAPKVARHADAIDDDMVVLSALTRATLLDAVRRVEPN